MPNRVEKCPLCNFEVALSSNHPHNYLCANLHRPFSQWLGIDSGYPVYAHPDEEQPLPEAEPKSIGGELLDEFLSSSTFSDLSPTDEDNPSSGLAESTDASTPDTPDPDFGGSDKGFAGGGGGDSF